VALEMWKEKNLELTLRQQLGEGRKKASGDNARGLHSLKYKYSE